MGGFHKVISVLGIFFVRQIRQIQRIGNRQRILHPGFLGYIILAGNIVDALRPVG